MTGAMGNESLAERLPSRAELDGLDANIKNATLALELADSIVARLDEEVEIYNGVFDNGGVIGAPVSLQVFESYAQGNDELEYSRYSKGNFPMRHTVDGTFQGLKVLNTSDADYSGTVYDERPEIKPDRLIICVAIASPIAEGITQLVPLTSFEGDYLEERLNKFLDVAGLTLRQAGLELPVPDSQPAVGE